MEEEKGFKRYIAGTGAADCGGKSAPDPMLQPKENGNAANRAAGRACDARKLLENELAGRIP